ncbi:transcriptional regulator [Clostridia bacterium]|nr:transcriptional regulator [Clostridia bacterium]
MNYENAINQILEKQDGFILSNDLTKNKIPRIYLSRMVQNGKLEKAERGIYITPNTWEDDMFILQARYSKAVFSHETALFLHGMTEVTPDRLSITIPNDYSSSTLSRQHVRIRTSTKKHYSLGITKKETSYGREVKVYDVERTLCDILKKTSHCDIRFVNTAFRQYINSGNYNLRKLNDYSEILKTKLLIKKYLSVLL